MCAPSHSVITLMTQKTASNHAGGSNRAVLGVSNCASGSNHAVLGVKITSNRAASNRAGVSNCAATRRNKA